MQVDGRTPIDAKTYQTMLDGVVSEVQAKMVQSGSVDPGVLSQMKDKLGDIFSKVFLVVPTPMDGGGVTTGSLLGSLGGAETNLKADMFAFMELFQKLAQEMRSSAKLQREASLQSEVASIGEQVTKMRSAAAFRFAAGMVSGAMSIASGFVTLGSLSGKLGGAGSGMFSAQNLSTAEGAGAAGRITDGLGKMVSAGLEFAASEADANAKKEEGVQKVHQARAQEMQELMQQMMDIIRDVREKMQAIEQSHIESTRGIARNI